MKKLLTYLLTATMLFAVSCAEDFDDSQIWDKLNSLENRVAALEQLCKQMNTNISSLQTVVNALQNNDYVTNIAPITEDGKVIGYTITFSKSGAVTIYHGKDGKDGANGADGADGADGKDGKDGYTPVIGVAKDSDGIYYWTLDGDWLLDKDGNKVKAEGVDGKNGQDGVNGADGQDGANGKDGIIPKLKIENGYWHISYDDGATWTELGKATGEDGADGKDGQDGADGKDGDSMFKDVTYDDEYVYITLTDGSVLEIPRHTIQNNEIWYTSSDGKIVTPDPLNRNSFGVNILSNEYKNGRGVITFDGNITTIGEMAFIICKTLTSVTIPKSVTSIKVHAFGGCSALTEITIPDGVTEIGISAFSETAITSITLPDGITQIDQGIFSGCTSLTEINIPDGVTAIKNGAFDRCTSLTEINIPDGVTAIGNNAFKSCSALTEITIPDSVTSIGDSAFSGCSALTEVTIPDGVTTIESNAFNECNSLKSFYGKYATSDNRCLVIDGVLIAFAPAELTSYTIPDNVTVIGDYIFQNYFELTSITIPDSVTSIGDGAFEHCTSLTEITILNGVTEIGEGAFLDCSALTNITIPESVKEIDTGAFIRCSSLKAFHGKYASADNRCLVINGVLTAFAPAELTTYTTPDNVTEIGENAFSYCTSLTNINISNGVKSIEQYAFERCTSLTKINIPNSVTEIGGYAFSDCSSLTKINIPNSVTEIGVFAFRCCSSLTEITIPESVTTIGWGAFSVAYKNECSLTTIYCKSSTPPTTAVGDSMPIPSLQKIYVPTASVDAYKVANGWKNHADKIVGYDFSE